MCYRYISSQYGLIVNENKTKYMKCTRRESKLEKLTVGDTQIDQVKSFSCLGSTVNGNGTLEEEIRERIAKGNKAFYANKALFQSKLVSRRSKLKLYQTVIRPGPPLWSSGQSFWLQIQRSRVRFPALPDFSE